MNAELVREVLRYPGRSTRAIVDLDAITTNLRTLRGATGSGVGLMAIVKANAYGHGAIPVATSALAAGAEHLAVATVDEAIQLRMASIQAPILILGPMDYSEIDLAIGHSIELSIGSLDFARAVGRAAEQFEVTSPVRIHVKLDTGMHRFGSYFEEALAIAQFVEGHPLLRLRGVFTHFAQSDEIDVSPTQSQADKLASFVDNLAVLGIRPELVHQSNSAAVIRSRSFDRSLVRIGIAMYGLNPSSDIHLLEGMRPAMTIISRVARISELQTGDAVSYGATFRANKRTRAALIPIGYADGYPRALSNRAKMYVHDVECPVLGRICMDQTIIGLPDVLDVNVGDPVMVSGAWHSEHVMSFDTIAELTGTISYEIATRIAHRVPRFYLRKGNVTSLSDLSGHRVVSGAFRTNE